MAFSTAATLCIALLSLCAMCQAGIIRLEDEQLMPLSSTSYRMVMDTKNSSHGSKDPYIEVKTEFSLIGAESKDATVWILAYYWTAATGIGTLDDDGTARYCCEDDDDVKLFDCQIGGPIVSGGISVQQSDVKVDADNGGEFTQTYEIPNAGPYYVQLLNCDASETIVADGKVEFRNPYGYLSGDIWYYLPFFGFLSLLYIGLGLYWAFLSIKHRKLLLMVQNWIAAVICLGLLECVTWYLELEYANASGSRNWAAVEVAIASSVLKRTVSRLLVVVVSMGYGVVKYDLGRSTFYKVAAIGIAYFACSLIESSVEIFAKEGDTSEFTSFLATMITFPLALIDTIFYWWIFLSLMRTIQQLTMRQASVKLLLYRRFFYVLIGAAIVTVLVILFQLVQALQALMSSKSVPDSHWQTEWLYDAIWHLLYYSVLVSIAVLWRPTINNTRYAYTESEDAEIMLEEVTSTEPEIVVDGITQRTKGDATAPGSNPGAIDDLTLPSFSIEDDDDDFLDEPSKLD